MMKRVLLALVTLLLTSVLLAGCALNTATLRDPQTGYQVTCKEQSVLDRANLRWWELMFAVFMFAPASGGYTSDYNKCITDAEHRGYERISYREESD